MLLINFRLNVPRRTPARENVQQMSEDVGWPTERRTANGEWTEGEIAPAISYPSLRSLYDYWRARERPGALPGRRDIDPIEMKFMLGNLILVDVERAPAGQVTDFRYRLIGSNLVDRLQSR